MNRIFRISALAAALTTSAACAAEPAGLVNATGTVLERVRIWDSGGFPRDLGKVRSTEGRILVADLGVPGGEATVQEGDRVVVTGRGFDIGGETLVLGPLVSETMNRGDLEARTRGDDAAFAVLDDDADGRIARGEAADLPDVGRRFDALDHDRDGWLSRSEVGPALVGLLEGR